MQAHQQNPEESQTVTVRQMRNVTEPQVDTKPLAIYISSCWGMDSMELEKWRELLHTAGEPVELVGDPASAAIILVTGFDQTNWFKALRGNSVWKRFPEKSFGISESDCPPRFLHGLYSGVPKKWNRMKRFSDLAYNWHREQHPNPVPPPEEVAAAAKKYLFSYIGRSSHPVRSRILKSCQGVPSVFAEDSTGVYNHFIATADQGSRHEYYWNIMKASKYGLCPAGASPSSIRVFEMMEAGIAPVIVSDQWVPPLGPDWESFCLRVPESKVGDLPSIVGEIESEYAERGRLAREAWERWFSKERYGDFLIRSIRHIQQSQRVPERFYSMLEGYFIAKSRLLLLVFRTMITAKQAARRIGLVRN
jgi:hypothetical protein